VLTDEAIILAGGLGTRLASVVPDLPKPMAPVAGRPFLEWQLDYLVRQEIRRVVLAIGHRGDCIVEHFGTRYGNAEIVYAGEQSPLGTGGALKAALRFIRGAGAFALNGNTLLLAPLEEIEGGVGESMVMAIRKAPNAGRLGCVALLGDRISHFEERPAIDQDWVNAGLYWVSRHLFDNDEKRTVFSFETEFLPALAASVQPRAARTNDFFVDIGTPDTYRFADTAIPEAFDHWVANPAAEGSKQGS